VEAYAVMGRVHPFFEKGGMVKRSESGVIEGPVYYLLDRGTEGGKSEVRNQKSDVRCQMSESMDE
jgi:hypothetical protein